MATDPSTGRELPDSAIQRVVFVTNDVHVYGIPPITSTRGFSASSWTATARPTAQEIFKARLRIIETSIEGRLKVDIVLEDGGTGDLFAAAPYTSSAAVQQAEDSSRFFAVRVVGEGGMRATLGIGFEDRAPALDFNIALTEMRKVLGWELNPNGPDAREKKKAEMNVQRDFGLKEGESIRISMGSKARSSVESSRKSEADESGNDVALFSIAPPPRGARLSAILSPAPPVVTESSKSAAELGFDDGEFGEFQ